MPPVKEDRAMRRKRRGRGEGSVYPLPDGRWAASVSLGLKPNGKRRRRVVTARTKALVLEKLKGLGLLPGDVTTFTVRGFLAHWLKSAGLNPTTHEKYERVVRLHIAPRIGHLKLSALAPLHVQTLYAELKGMDTRPVATALGSALAWAVQMGLVPHNVARDVKRPRVEEKELAVWTADEVQRFWRHTKKDRLHALYVTAVGTGMRRGELLGLEWADVDLDAARLSVRRQWTRLTGSKFVLKECKTKKSKRRIDLPGFVVDALREHRKRMLKEGNAGAPVFCTRRGTHVWPNWLTRVWKPLLQAAGVPHVRLHDLRHCSATLMLLAGVHPKVVSERLGHSTVAQTLNRYSHVLPTMQAEAAQKLDRMLG
jgi:integrase